MWYLFENKLVRLRDQTADQLNTRLREQLNQQSAANQISFQYTTIDKQIHQEKELHTRMTNTTSSHVQI